MSTRLMAKFILTFVTFSLKMKLDIFFILYIYKMVI